MAVLVWCDERLEAEGGRPKPPENLEETTATATRVLTETDQVKPTESQKLPLMEKIRPPLSKLTLYLTIPREGVKTNPLLPLWPGGHPSGGGGNALRGHLTGDDKQ
jgi:hypothetical protein